MTTNDNKPISDRILEIVQDGDTTNIFIKPDENGLDKHSYFKRYVTPENRKKAQETFNKMVDNDPELQKLIEDFDKFPKD